MQKSFIITAGGIGKRMNSVLPKQFLELGNKPILLVTLENLHAFDSQAEFIITLPTDWMDYWKEILTKHSCTIPHQVISGGQERFHSIKNALEAASGEVIAIHDGVRPFVSHQTLERLFQNLNSNKAVIPVFSIKESLRKIDISETEHVNRDNFKLVQTPQCFERTVIIEAYQQDFNNTFTDDASVVEANGCTIAWVDGNEENIKITSPFDLLVAQTLLKNELP
jgi:2-C-methyl-D-erythritol 4-phosphate cytidylyltransferase